MTTERDEEGRGGEKGKRRRKKWKGGKVEERRRTGEFGEEVEGEDGRSGMDQHKLSHPSDDVT